MYLNKPFPALITLCLAFTLTGCQASKPDTPDATSADPGTTIEGAWSKPVNGIRMAAGQVIPGDARAGNRYKGLDLILFIQNVSDKDVYLPRLEPELERRLGSLNTMDEMSPDIGEPNLRIITEPMDGQAGTITSRCFSPLQERLESIQAPILPGEIRTYLIRMDGQMHKQQLQQLVDQTRDELSGYTVSWLDLYQAKGHWRITLVYRPGGFPPGNRDPKDLEVKERDVYAGWENQQIVLPPLDIQLYADGQATELKRLGER